MANLFGTLIAVKAIGQVMKPMRKMKSKKRCKSKRVTL